jgi:hypothetical protein
MGKTVKMFLAGFLSVGLTVGAAFPASAEVTLEQVLKRVEALEAENIALKNEVNALKGTQVSQAAEITDVKSKAVAVAAVSAAPAQGNFLKTGMDISLYGFIKADGIYSTADQNTANTYNTLTIGSSPRITTGKQINTFNATAADTRLGLKFKAPEADNGAKITGQFEMDFAGSGASDTVGVYKPRLRLAYAQVDFERWGLMAGQNWDFFAPLNSNTLNASALNRDGNLGNRHPQMYVTAKWGEFLGGKWATKLGVIDTDDPLQENSGIPVYAAYQSYETKLFGAPATFGVGGIYGKNATSLGLGIKGPVNDTIYATTLGMTIKPADWLWFKSEGYSGAKLDDFQGGNSTGVSSANLATTKPIRVMGGFAELTYNPIKKLENNYGIGLDTVANDAQTLADPAASWRTNRTYYTNVKYSLTKDLILAVEYQFLKTDWLDGTKGSTNRIQSSVILKF